MVLKELSILSGPNWLLMLKLQRFTWLSPILWRRRWNYEADWNSFYHCYHYQAWEVWKLLKETPECTMFPPVDLTDCACAAHIVPGYRRHSACGFYVFIKPSTRVLGIVLSWWKILTLSLAHKVSIPFCFVSGIPVLIHIFFIDDLF